MKKHIGIISLGTGGTMGHMTLTTKLAHALLKNKNISLHIFSEYIYNEFSNIKNRKIKYFKLTKQKHMKSIGGCINYKYKKKLISEIEKRKIKVLIFSTFFDVDILKYAIKKKIKTILISYPLRDSHRKAILCKEYYKLFDTILTLKDISELKKLFPNEEIVSPILPASFKERKKNQKIKHILITCGGGGRPSSEIFFKKISRLILKMSKECPSIKFTVIAGLSGMRLKLPNMRIIKWSRNFLELLKKADLVISEAGYFTLLDLLSTGKPAILIPGSRRIDNQELRAIDFEHYGCGHCFFPEEKESCLYKKLIKLIENPKKLLVFSSKINMLNKAISDSKRIDKATMEKIK